MAAADELFRGARVLVTGGLGFVGRRLVARLLAAGAEVAIVDVRENPDPGARPGATTIRLDMARGAELRAAVREIRPRFVFHLASIVTASRDPDLIDPMIESNLRGTTNLLRALDGLSGLEGVVHLGTCEEHGDRDALPGEPPREQPASPYAVLKLAATHFCRMFSRRYGIPITTVRPANLYGPGQPAGKLVPYAILRCLRNEPVEATSGEQRRDFLYVDDLVAAVLLVASKVRGPGETFDVGSGGAVRVRDVVETIRDLTASRSELRFGAVADREGEMTAAALDARKVRALGWAPEHGLAEGLRLTIEHYRREADRP